MRAIRVIINLPHDISLRRSQPHMLAPVQAARHQAIYFDPADRALTASLFAPHVNAPKAVDQSVGASACQSSSDRCGPVVINEGAWPVSPAYGSPSPKSPLLYHPSRPKGRLPFLLRAGNKSAGAL